MKLTKTLREAFVRAAMGDVPSVDFHQQIQKAVTADALVLMPPDVRTAYKKHPEYFANVGHYFQGGGYIYAPAPTGIKFPESLHKEVARLTDLESAQAVERKTLRANLMGAANSVTTIKALADLLPEFAQYLPVEEPISKNLPALANLVADFTKAGWPK